MEGAAATAVFLGSATAILLLCLAHYEAAKTVLLRVAKRLKRAQRQADADFHTAEKVMEEGVKHAREHVDETMRALKDDAVTGSDGQAAPSDEPKTTDSSSTSDEHHGLTTDSNAAESDLVAFENPLSMEDARPSTQKRLEADFDQATDDEHGLLAAKSKKAAKVKRSTVAVKAYANPLDGTFDMEDESRPTAKLEADSARTTGAQVATPAESTKPSKMGKKATHVDGVSPGTQLAADTKNADDALGGGVVASTESSTRSKPPTDPLRWRPTPLQTTDEAQRYRQDLVAAWRKHRAGEDGIGLTNPLGSAASSGQQLAVNRNLQVQVDIARFVLNAIRNHHWEDRRWKLEGADDVGYQICLDGHSDEESQINLLLAIVTMWSWSGRQTDSDLSVWNEDPRREEERFLFAMHETVMELQVFAWHASPQLPVWHPKVQREALTEQSIKEARLRQISRDKQSAALSTQITRVSERQETAKEMLEAMMIHLGGQASQPRGIALPAAAETLSADSMPGSIASELQDLKGGLSAMENSLITEML